MKKCYRFSLDEKFRSYNEIDFQNNAVSAKPYSHVVIAPTQAHTLHFLHSLIVNGVARIELPLLRQLSQFFTLSIEALSEHKIDEINRLITCIQFEYTGTLRILGNLFSTDFIPSYLNSLLLLEFKRQNPSANITLCFGEEELYLLQTLRTVLGSPVTSYQSSSIQKGFEHLKQLKSGIPDNLLQLYFSGQCCKWIPFDIEVLEEETATLFFGSKLYDKRALEALCVHYLKTDPASLTALDLFNQSALRLIQHLSELTQKKDAFFPFLDEICHHLEKWEESRSEESRPFAMLFINVADYHIASHDAISHYVGSAICRKRNYQKRIYRLGAGLNENGYIGLLTFQYHLKKLQFNANAYTPRPTKHHYHPSGVRLHSAPASLYERLRFTEHPTTPLQNGLANVYAIGDLHGNALKLLQFLISKKIVRCSQLIYNSIVHHYFKENHEHTVESLNELKSLINQITLQETPSRVILIGDILCDRSRNDYLTLLILSHLRKEAKKMHQKIKIQFPLSNHDFEFMMRFYRALQTDALLEHNHSISNDEKTTRMLKALTEPGYLKEEYTRSFQSIVVLFQRGCLTFTELSTLFFNYLKCLTFLPFAIGSNNTLTLFTHCPIDEALLIALGEQFDLPFPQNETLSLATLTTWLHRFNNQMRLDRDPHHFEEYTRKHEKQIRKLREGFTKDSEDHAIIPLNYALLYLTENRIAKPNAFPSLTQKGIVLYNVHGHVGSNKQGGFYDGAHCNLDTEYGKSREDEKTRQADIPLILSLEEDRSALLHLYRTQRHTPLFFDRQGKRETENDAKHSLSKRAHAS